MNTLSLTKGDITQAVVRATYQRDGGLNVKLRLSVIDSVDYNGPRPKVKVVDIYVPCGADDDHNIPDPAKGLDRLTLPATISWGNPNETRPMFSRRKKYDDELKQYTQENMLPRFEKFNTMTRQWEECEWGDEGRIQVYLQCHAGRLTRDVVEFARVGRRQNPTTGAWENYTPWLANTPRKFRGEDGTDVECDVEHITWSPVAPFTVEPRPATVTAQVAPSFGAMLD